MGVGCVVGVNEEEGELRIVFISGRSWGGDQIGPY
jgi:hypothetical protein